MVTVKTVSSLDKVFACFGPKLYENSGTMLKNERYNFQISFYNNEYNIAECGVEIESDIKDYCILRYVQEIPGQYTYCPASGDDYVLFREDSARLYPDLLRPILAGDIFLRGGQWTTLWCTVYAKDGIPAGEHEIKVRLILQGGKEVSASYCIKVIDDFLPESDLIYTNWMHYDGIAEYYNLKPFSPQFYKVLGSFLDTAVLHGMNMLYTPIFTPALDTKIGGERTDVQLLTVFRREGEYSFDFSKLKKFVLFAQERGIKYFELSHLTTQWGAKFCPKIMAHTEEGYQKIFGWDTLSLGEEYKRFLTSLLPKLCEFFKSLGLKDVTYFHISDEPNEEQLETYRSVYDIVKPLIGSFKMIDATNRGDSSYLDAPVKGINHYDGNKKSWVYYCCSQNNGYIANRFFNMPSQRNRILGMQLYLSGIPGFLQWGYNFYNTSFSRRGVNPFAETDAGGNFQSGDSFIVYPGADGAWDSLRLEVFFDGLQDRCALQLLEKYIGGQEVTNLLKREGISGFNVYPRSAEWHISFRQKINELIEKNKDSVIK